MFSMKTLRTIAAATLLFAPLPGWSVFDPVNDDTDIFLANPSFSATRPNVLIFVDNTANWNTAFDTEKAALVSVINGLNSSFNVGFAMYVETGGANDSIDGAYVRYGIRQMTDTNKYALGTMVNALDKIGDKGNNATLSLAMAEMYRYFAGASSYSGFGKAKRDYAGNSVYNPQAAVLPGNPFASAASTTYISPIIDPCQKNFIIFISNGPAGDNSSSLEIAQNHLAGLVGQNPPPTITINPNGEQGMWGDEYAKFMSNSDCNPALDGVQNVYTYTVDVLPGASGQGPSHTANLQSMAANGKGKYFPITNTSTTTQLENALKAIFNEVQAVNNVFAATTLPVSVNVRGTNLNQVYIGVFRPDANKSPRWLGNLKLYRLNVNTATKSLYLADANGNAAENESTGFITGSAVSYWTQPSTYWSYRDSALNGEGGSSDSPDGDLVEKGAVAQRLRLDYPTDQSTRNLYTCVDAALTGLCASGSLLSDSPFTSAKVNAADLGAFTSYTANSLTSSGDVATLVLPAAPNPVWAAANTITISGASPENFNVSTCPLASADNTTLTYTFSLSACGKTAPDNATAQAAAPNHGLQTGDLVTVSAANSTFDVTDASISRVSADVFRYTKSGVSGTNAALTVTGKKLVNAITSPSGLAPTATAVIPAHNYGNPGSTVSLTFSGASPSAYNNGGVPVTATIQDADTVTYTVVGSVTGSGTTARATSTAHGYSNGQTVFVEGANEAVFNTPSGVPITVIDANTFTYTLSGTATGTATGSVLRASLRIKYITHANNSDTATVTLYGSHNWTPSQNIIIQGTGGVATTGYDAPFGAASGTGWSISNINQAAGTFDITYSATGANRLRNAPACLKGSSSDPNPAGHTSCTVMAGMSAGRAINALGPVVQATGTIYAAKSVSVSGLSSLTTATGSISAGRTADGDNAARDAIIAWVRGADNKENENPVTTPAGSDIRPSVHGDVLHSRPAVVNYNRFGDDNDIYAFYGANDGIFRAVKGGTGAHATGAEADRAIAPGRERWGFIPREFFDRLKRLRDQTPTISNATQKDYFADGSIGVYHKDARGNGNASSPLDCDPADTTGCSAATVTGVVGDNVHPTKGDKVYLYLTMRRGGNFVYALDVTNPGAPKLLWRKGSGDIGWEQLGQTWSEPKVVKVQANLGNASNPENVVLIFGAGYDDALEDVNPCLLQQATLTSVVQKAIGAGSITYTAAGSCTISNPTGSATTINRTRGRGIMVVDAFNGQVVWQAGGALTTSATAGARKLRVSDMTCAIPSDTTVLDKNRDQFADRIYVGDTCGQLWRVDIASSDMDQWTVTKIANVSSTTDDDIANKRKFLFAPDLVFGADSVGNYTAVTIGTGDREHPFDAIINNRFYMFKDRDSSDPSNPQVGAPNASSVKIAGFGTAPTGEPLTDADLFDATNVVLADPANTLGQNGWKIRLFAGEKVVSGSVTLGGTTFFNTNQPSASAGGGSCGSNLGIARQYQVGFADAAATSDRNGSGGITIDDRSKIIAGGGYLPSPVPAVVEIDGNKYEGVLTGPHVEKPPGTTLEARTRIYWYKEVE